MGRREQRHNSAQHYSPEDDIRHIRALRQAFFDDRYVRWGDKPVLLVYRASKLPNPLRTTQVWRPEAESWGLPASTSFASRAFPMRRVTRCAWVRRSGRVPAEVVGELDNPSFFGSRAGYASRSGAWGHFSICKFLLQPGAVRVCKAVPYYVRWPGVTPRWDNTPRGARDAGMFVGSSPGRLRRLAEFSPR